MPAIKTAPIEAIILAGGRGERLRPFTNDRPKSMIEVGEKHYCFTHCTG